MSKENVQTIIGRAIMEPEYRASLFKEPDKALEGYELTDEETQSLKNLDPEKFDQAATQVEERISKSGLGFRFASGFPKVEISVEQFMKH